MPTSPVSNPYNGDPYAPTSWTAAAEEDFTCPSGQRCLLRKIDIMEMMSSGLMDRFDFITAETDKRHVSKKSSNSRARRQPKSDDELAREMWDDKKQRADMILMMNTIVTKAVVKPELHTPPTNWDDRQDELIYVDTVQLLDRLAIIQHVFGGIKELARFRSQFEQLAVSVDDVESVESTS
jgi:hypothetical protein